MFSGFLQVRGTPASGKSTLAMLLGRYIRVQESNVRVIWIGGWKLDEMAEWGMVFLPQKTKGLISGEDTLFIFYDAQSYKDVEHLRSSTYKALEFSSHLERGSVSFLPPTRTISELRVSFSPLQSSTSWFQSTIQTQSITSIHPSSTWS